MTNFLAARSSSRSLVVCRLVGKITFTRKQEYHLILYNNSCDSSEGIESSDSRRSSDRSDSSDSSVTSEGSDSSDSRDSL